MTRKNVFFIVSSILIFSAAGNCAFADGAVSQLNNGSPNFDGLSNSFKPVDISFGAAGFAKLNANVPAAASANGAARNPAASSVPPIAAPSYAGLADAAAEAGFSKPENPIKKFLGGHKTEITVFGIGAYLGYAIAATAAGALTGGLAFLGLVALANL